MQLLKGKLFVFATVHAHNILSFAAKNKLSPANTASKTRNFSSIRGLTKVFDRRQVPGSLEWRLKMSTEAEEMGGMCSASRSSFQEQEQMCKILYESALVKVAPGTLIRNHVKWIGPDKLQLSHYAVSTRLPDGTLRKCWLVGFGKAVLPMAEAMKDILGSFVTRCVVSIPDSFRSTTNSSIEVYQGSKNNMPDDNSLRAGEEIVRLMKAAEKDDLVICLISGGGSALLPVPKSPVTIEEKAKLVSQLSRAGATIEELNIVRRKISAVKGGRLAAMCRCQIVSLIISDVIGDSLEVIASGPTVPHSDSQLAAEVIVKRLIPYGVSIPESVQAALAEITPPAKHHTIKPINFIIGSNAIAILACVEALREKSSAKGYVPIVVTSRLHGEAKFVGSKLAQLAATICDDKLSSSDILQCFRDLEILDPEFEAQVATICDTLVEKRKAGSKMCLLFGGETIVHVVANGEGGRNQELALAAGIQLNQLKPESPITIMSFGTDGQDGPTSAAGAVVNNETIKKAKQSNLDPLLYLNTNDSFHFFQKLNNGANHIITGYTETNVMDLIVVLIDTVASSHLKSKM